MQQSSNFINRELSWLEFNFRVLHEAFDERNTLLERLKFLAIFSSNLDEFYMVRVAGLRRQVATGLHPNLPDGMSPADQLVAVNARVGELIALQQSCLHDILLPALESHGVKLLGIDQLTPEESRSVDAFFESQVFPVLTPLAIDPTHPFPYISNLSLSLAVQIFDPGAATTRFARVKVPKSLPRWVSFGRENQFIPLEQVIGANLEALFPGMEIQGYNAFRVTRYSDLELAHLEEQDDLLSLIEEQVFQRRFAEVVRLEIESGMPLDLKKLVIEEVRADQPEEMPPLADAEIIEAGPLLDLADLMPLASLEIPALRDAPFVACTPPEFRDPARSVFDVLRERDVLVHHPFDSFSASVEHFLTSAAGDENVLAIKMTLYRTSGDTAVVRALTEAAQRGKQVAVLIEIQARFDEANNITFARTLESFGVHVAYGLAGLKTHAKTVLVVRKEGEEIRRYSHIGTGNYNSKTARVYTDVALFTANPSIGADLSDLFNALTGFSRQTLYRKLLVAPGNMRRRLLELIARETENARNGLSARLMAKMNALVDAEIVQALYAASQAGVRVDLIVRGICCLRPGVPGLSENIRVLSIVGRFLEHSRIFFFSNAGAPEVFIGSADWMPRNLDRRVETLVPVEDPQLGAKLRSLLEVYLDDNRHAWDLMPDATYVQRTPDEDGVRSSHLRLLRDSWGMVKEEHGHSGSEPSAAEAVTQSALPTSSS